MHFAKDVRKQRKGKGFASRSTIKNWRRRRDSKP